MVALKPPFLASNINDLYKKVIIGKYKKIPSYYSANLAKVIDSLL